METPAMPEGGVKLSPFPESGRVRAAALPRLAQFLLCAGLAISITMVISHRAATSLGLANGKAVYRRVGPADGPQILCAGSSLLQFGLSWPEVSQSLGRGIENWGLGGSTPSEWEVFQRFTTNSDLMIVGVSLYDLNENHLCDGRADVVPFTQTINDLWKSGSSWQFSKRLVSQYPMALLRTFVPTVGRSDAVLVGLRRMLPSRFRAAAAAEDRANSTVLPSEGVLVFGASVEKVSDWPAAKTLRRVALMRSENRGEHVFDGPKYLAFLRMLQRAQEHGKIVVVVLPVAPVYSSNFITPQVQKDFEKTLAETCRRFPQALFVRLDQDREMQSDALFSDPVHLNGDGRTIATAAFLKAVKQHWNQQ